jgi:hypothetical protein
VFAERFNEVVCSDNQGSRRHLGSLA